CRTCGGRHSRVSALVRNNELAVEFRDLCGRRFQRAIRVAGYPTWLERIERERLAVAMRHYPERPCEPTSTRPAISFTGYVWIRNLGNPRTCPYSTSYRQPQEHVTTVPA